MNITAAQMIPIAEGAEGSGYAAQPQPSSGRASSSSPAPKTTATTAHATLTPQLSTDMKLDDQHEVYYAIVDKSTGSVLFEIPPEALRAIAESLNLPTGDAGTGHELDVKS